MKSAITGVAQLASGEIVLVSRLGQLVRGRLDAGDWTVHTPELGQLAWAVSEGPRLWLGTSTGLQVSHDGGARFEARGADGARWSRVVPLDGALLACRDGAVVRSIDDGRTWEDVLRVDDHFGVVDLARGPGAVVLAVGLAARVFVSHDLGRTFSLESPGPAEAFVGVAVQGEHAFYLRAARLERATLSRPGEHTRVDPASRRAPERARVVASADAVWLAGEYEVLRSRDAGASWETVTEGECVFLDVLPVGPRRAVVTRSDGTAFLLEG